MMRDIFMSEDSIFRDKSDDVAEARVTDDIHFDLPMRDRDDHEAFGEMSMSCHS